MFYSQFILAKKGPLGTIWIAAHLERKLKKNQVADTDIGVSVDSILFPEVPIALRLSSHLLLGVVRIYSRKVNYLFNDCSETLVKIKQAFRSSAVDLPPDASTAPYHSITLPETFDLDDLELPESSFSHGNFVDHHVTTREQITLQDPVEDTVYLGSQFGLDERFGDGDTPQTGLDFDEDLFADRVCSPGPSSAATCLGEAVLPSTLAAEGTYSNKMEIDGQESCIPAVDSSRLDEDGTRDCSTIQPSIDHSGQQIDLDSPNALPPAVAQVVHLSSKGIHTPDLNKEVFPCSSLQGPSTPRLSDETITVPISNSLQKSQLFISAEVSVPVLTSQTVAAAFCSVSGTSKGLEQVEMLMFSEDSRPALTTAQFEEIKQAGTKILNKLQVQPDIEGLKENLPLAQTELIKDHHHSSIAFHAHEGVNLAHYPKPPQEVMMKTSKEMLTASSNLQSTASSTFSLAMAPVPSPSVHYELDVSKQQLHTRETQAPTSYTQLENTVLREQDVSPLGIRQLNQVGDGKKQLHLISGSQGLPNIFQLHDNHEIQAPTNYMQKANTVFREQDVSTLGIQQLNQVGDGKKQLHLASGSQGFPEILQVHDNQTLHTSVQQSPIAIQTFSSCLSGPQLNPASGLQSAVDISGTQELGIHESHSSTTVIPDMQEVSPMEFQQQNKVAECKQQLQSSAVSREHAQVTNMQNAMINTCGHQNATDMHTLPPCLSSQQFNLASGCNSVVGMSGTQELPIHGFPALAATISNTQKVSTMENPHHLNQVANSRPAAQEYSQLTQTQNFVVSTTAQEFNKPMQAFPLSGEHHNVTFKHQSALRMSETKMASLGSISEPSYVASQNFRSPQRFHAPETSIKASNVGAIEGPWLRACNEEVNQHQSLHVSAAATKSFLHGVQLGDSNTGENSAFCLSSDMQRIPTNVPFENTYAQNASVSLPTGLLEASKGQLDGSTAAQHSNFCLETGMRENHAYMPSGNIVKGTSFPLQVQTFGNLPSRNILQPCSFPTHAGTYGVYTDAPSENILMRNNNFPRVTESEGIPTNVTASKKSGPATSQHQAFSNAFDELSNALSLSQAQDVTATIAEQFETIQPQPETTRRSVLESPAYETLRSSDSVFRNEPDILGSTQLMTERATPRDADKNIISSNQSVGSRKRHMMDSTPFLKEITPKSRNRSSLSNRSLDYIPHDDDVLASILGRTPSFKIKPTPAEAVAAKRPRRTPRTTGRKRKALIDIAMVIHGEVIRQQLANTEDIRRVRKKAPCTTQEIRMLQKDSQADYIFFEPSIPGLCTELRDLCGEVVGLTGSKLPQVDKNENSAETQKTQEPTSSLEPTYDSRMLKLGLAERPHEIVSEIQSSGVRVNNFHMNKAHMDNVYGSRLHMHDDHINQEQDRSFDIVSKKRSHSMHMDNIHDKREQERPEEIGCAAECSRVHMDDAHKEQEQEKLQDVHVLDVHQNQEKEPQKMVCDVESSRVDKDVHQAGGQERLCEIVSGRVLSSVESSQIVMETVQQKQDKERPQQMVLEIESHRSHTDDVHWQQEQEQEMLCEIVSGSVLSSVESSKIVTETVHQKQDQQIPQKMLLELESDRSHPGGVHWQQEQEQERPQQILLETESNTMHMGDVHRSHTGDVHRQQEQEQERPQQIVLETESNRLHTADVYRSHTGDVYWQQEQEQERPQQIVLETESNRMHTVDVHRSHTGDFQWQKEQEQKRPQQIVLEPESNKMHTGDVHRSHTGDVYWQQQQEQERPQKIGLETESNRVHMGDVHRSHTGDVQWQQELDQERPQQIALVTESNRMHTGDVQGKQDSIAAFPEKPNNVVIGLEDSNLKRTIESSMVQEGYDLATNVFMPRDTTSGACQVPGPQDSSALESGCFYNRVQQEQQQERPQQIVLETGFNRMHMGDFQGKQASIVAFPEKPINDIIGLEDLNVKKTLESSMVQQGYDLATNVFVPRDNTFGACKVPGPHDSSALESGCFNNRNIYLSNHQSPLNSSCLTANHEMPLEGRSGSIVFAPKQVSLVSAEKHVITVQDREASQFHGEDLEARINEVQRALIINEPNITQDRNKESQEIAVIEKSPVNGTIEETVQDCELQRQKVSYSAVTASSLSFQGKDSLSNNNVDTGELVNLNRSGKALGNSAQNFGVENTKQDEHVMVYENLTEMPCSEADVPGDMALKDREDHDGPNQETLRNVSDEDEEFDFLGDANNTEGEGDAQAEFDGKGKALDTEEDQIEENSGWSARTRAVSRYLKTVFEGMDYNPKKPESENRQKLSLDHLLVGKRRKEAARMFFETLVLKTRDYVHVEQTDSFEDINIYPRAKLMNISF